MSVEDAGGSRYSNAAVMECRFCGRSDLTPQGHPTHETYCDENPNHGVPYKKQEEHGLLEDVEYGEDPAGRNPNPNQNPDSGTGLPARKELPGEEKDTGTSENRPDVPRCPKCGSEELVPSFAVRSRVEDEHPDPPDALLTAFDAGEQVCSTCWRIWGGDLPGAKSLEVLA